tara:strand:- start:194 stop:427 length:234 start_codon:yes stop_codon:yes gene_type:complete
MSYSTENLKLILKIVSLAEVDLRSDLDSDEEQYRQNEEQEQGLSSIGATYLSEAFMEVTRLKNATQKLIEEREKSNV